MTNEEILQTFSDINYAYNNCTKYDTLKRMLDELTEPCEDTISRQPEVRPIDYQDCSNAMLKMWMDNVLTDGEYNRIMDKLNAHWGKRD